MMKYRLLLLYLCILFLVAGCSFVPLNQNSITTEPRNTTTELHNTTTTNDITTEPEMVLSSILLADDVVQKLQDYETDYVVRIFCHPHISYINSENPIENILTDVPCGYAVFNRSHEVTYKHIEEDFRKPQYTHCPFCGTSQQFNVEDLMKYIIWPTLVFGDETEVYNVYCVDGTWGWRGVSIFFFTDQGDYVLYREYALHDELFLIPLDDYYELTDAYVINGGRGYLDGREQYPFEEVDLAYPYWKYPYWK